ncbi:polysaccharide deacetylase [Thermosporothrix hazakensis]|jgi:peptidoglycan/xylan/chitin deacetylase (PgdA/CDA1 family)|uniref:Polysaccharide deacetylase n=3 Tax=Thermosporothrix TaxID=768650 RepID=A0A326TZR5_THEHA|nr:polysaccharide deacetylase family protein [Thermosporothrix hazakensis]PZW22944.1 polysaccharide deacetylase [Thermosporothrix hazakensis]BBH90036.1 hypothetical protein KTC_47870 [Thermosporothrix sp. COM3]GCE48257.1 hypothetical protein KTH_31260 [Thermosporothrix hazakensis]
MLMKTAERYIPILMYHSISQSANPRFKQLAVAPVMFAAQMDYLHRNGYTPLNVTQCLKAMQGKIPFPAKPVVITFDDGFADFYDYALPILTRYQFTATLYITTAYIGKTSTWLRPENETERPMLNWAQIEEIRWAGIECGAHTHTHPALDLLPLSLAREEIALSKLILEQRLGQEICSFAYPFGYYTPDVRELVQQLGFTSACAVNFATCAVTSHPFSLERLMVTPGMSIEAFRLLLHQEEEAPVLKRMYIRARIPVKQVLRSYSAALTRTRR